MLHIKFDQSQCIKTKTLEIINPRKYNIVVDKVNWGITLHFGLVKV